MDNEARIRRIKKQGFAFTLIMILGGSGLIIWGGKYYGIFLLFVATLYSLIWQIMLRTPFKARFKELITSIGYLLSGVFFLLTGIIVFGIQGCQQYLVVAFTLYVPVCLGCIFIKISKQIPHNWNSKKCIYDEYAYDDHKRQDFGFTEGLAVVASVIGMRLSGVFSGAVRDKVGLLCFVIVACFFLAYGLKKLANYITTLKLERQDGCLFQDKYLLLINEKINKGHSRPGVPPNI